MKALRMAVCMKQVPENAGKSLSQDGRIRREDRSAILNPADRFSLETALTLRERHGGQIDVFTMGTAAAQSLLQEAASLGADRLFLLSDRDFAGADTYATATVLAAALQKTAAYDLILCGRRTLDGETGQVPIQLAELLRLPVVTRVVGIEAAENGLLCRRLLEGAAETAAVALPAVLSIMEGMEDIGHPRLPSIFAMAQAARKEIVLLDRQALGLEAAAVGSRGSFTEVARVFFPDWKRSCRFCEAEEGLAFLREKIGQITEGREPQ